MRLRTIAHGRAGDKGRRVNLSVIAFDPADYPRLAREVTAERVRAHLADLIAGPVIRYELPQLGALNFVLERPRGRRRHRDARARSARQVAQLGAARSGDSMKRAGVRVVFVLACPGRCGAARVGPGHAHRGAVAGADGGGTGRRGRRALRDRSRPRPRRGGRRRSPQRDHPGSAAGAAQRARPGRVRRHVRAGEAGRSRQGVRRADLQRGEPRQRVAAGLRRRARVAGQRLAGRSAAGRRQADDRRAGRAQRRRHADHRPDDRALRERGARHDDRCRSATRRSATRRRPIRRPASSSRTRG